MPLNRPLLRSRGTTVLLAAGLLVGAANLGAYAANGHPLLLGHHNTSHGTTVVTNKGGGAALQLKTKSGAPPLKVSSSKKVKHLNADRVDGLSADSLANTALTYALPTVAAQKSFAYTFPGLPPGKFLISYNVDGTLKPSGSAPGYLTCSISPGPGTPAQLGTRSPSASRVTADNTGVLLVSSAAKIQCTAHGGTIALPASSYSRISFLKVDRVAGGTLGRTARAVR